MRNKRAKAIRKAMNYATKKQENGNKHLRLPNGQLVTPSYRREYQRAKKEHYATT